MTPVHEKTVAEFVLEHPAAARVLEKHGIDYCCGGKDPLGPALAARGIAIEQLEAELKSLEAAKDSADRDWTQAPLSELIRHILDKHHAYLRSELPRLRALLEKVLAAHRENHGGSLVPLSAVYHDLNAELESHMMKEEMILFPHVRRMEEALGKGEAPPQPPFGSVAGPIHVMEQEHDNAGAALRRMRELTGGYQTPEDGCLSYQTLMGALAELEADLHLHIHLENNILFPRAYQMERG
jgi:regulator of cell morphogenesis and NO signaling